MANHSEINIEDWHLSKDERQQIKIKNTNLRLPFAVLLNYFGLYGRFPKSPHEVNRAVIHELANQLHVDSSTWLEYNWSGRTIKLHRAEIRKSHGYRTATVKDGDNLVEWLCTECLGQTRRYEHIEAMAFDRLRSLKIESPTMLQEILAEQAWQNRMTKEDMRGLTPLLYNHINPYGNFLLDMTRRLDIERLSPHFVT